MVTIREKKELIIKLAESSCLVNRKLIWDLVNEIGKKEIEEDKEFSRELLKISMKQIFEIATGDRLF